MVSGAMVTGGSSGVQDIWCPPVPALWGRRQEQGAGFQRAVAPRGSFGVQGVWGPLDSVLQVPPQGGEAGFGARGALFLGFTWSQRCRFS